MPVSPHFTPEAVEASSIEIKEKKPNSAGIYGSSAATVWNDQTDCGRKVYGVIDVGS